MGCVVVVSLVAAVFHILKSNANDPKHAAHSNRLDGNSAAKTEIIQPFQIRPSIRPSLAENKQDTNTSASERLRHHLQVGDLNAVEEELTKLSDTGELASVANLLKEWCRGSSLEVSQWCLAYSEENYTDLNLALCAEALSNPSDVIRDFATARLENVTGIQFEDSSSARAWLSSQKVR